MATSQARIHLCVEEPIGTIQPNIYGHFAEHIGDCIYEGIYVGEDSSIPHTAGIRNDVVAALRKIHPPVVRWPGGCFADDYHWEDGIGPQEHRPRTVNLHWGQVIETNHFGTHEFIRFCRLIGAAPYLCGNVGSGSPREMRDWVEYCNFAGDSTLARQRGRNGHPEPFGVTYWGVGNENWGCGGSFDPEDYAAEYKRFATFLRDFEGCPLFLIACGPSGNNPDWTHRFFEKLGRFGRIHAFAAHYYCGSAGTATEYTEDQFHELLHRAVQMEKLIVRQRAIMDGYDPERRIGLIVDEWGTWHPGQHPRLLWQQNTLRDALVAALTLDLFNRHADKVVMANIAQTVNVLQAMILTHGAKMLTTPTYHVYGMYAPHQGGTSIRSFFEADEIAFKVGEEEQRFPALTGSASLKGKTLFLTVVNARAEAPIEAILQLRNGGEVVRATARVLTNEDIHAHNTFEAPEALVPRDEPISVHNGDWYHTFPPASVTAMRLTLRR